VVISKFNQCEPNTHCVDRNKKTATRTLSSFKSEIQPMLYTNLPELRIIISARLKLMLRFIADFCSS